ncbi:MAG: hypothetical protein ACLQVY_23135, partial [Limisphaerales bacterium]
MSQLGIPAYCIRLSDRSVSNQPSAGCWQVAGDFSRPLHHCQRVFTLRDRLRLCSAGSPTNADQIEFTLPAIPGGRCYGLALLVPLLSTPCCHDAVTVRPPHDSSSHGSELSSLYPDAITGAR